jgi:acyl-CoA reductase-like NAD-dependent aldehyde dehydrogenase
VLSETDLPLGAFSILPCSRGGADLFTEDPRLKLLSFTGSASVGWALKARAGKKKVVLELGGNAACVVDRDADITNAASRIVMGAFSQAGQSCISVQRIIVHEEMYDRFKNDLVGATRALRVGDPKIDTTAVGPLISEEEAARVESWIERAVRRGATLLCGGKRKGSVVEPTLLEGVPPDEPLSCEEVFGPVAVLLPFSSFDEALREVNRGRFGLQAGVFTRDLRKALRAWDECEVGGVIIGDIPSFRADHMPYGGVKDSGFGREGVRYAIEDMTEIRMLVLYDGNPS